MLNTLHKIGLKYGTDKTYSGYTVLYHMHLYNRRESVKSVLEIGIQNGYSLKMWEEYFPNAIIYGIDIDDKSEFNTDRIFTIKGNQADRNLLNSLPNDIDIIIDDGGHTMQQQMVSLGCLFKKVAPDGIYIVEDLGTSLMPVEAYGGNSDNIDTALSALENFMDSGILENSWLFEEERQYIMKNTDNIGIYGDYEECIGKYNPSNLGGIAAILYKKHYKANFLHVPKVAGCSLYKLIYNAEINSNEYGSSEIIKYWGHKKRATIISSPSFCFVRNPYDRLVGTYFYLMDDHAKDEPDISYKKILSKYTNFKDFVMNIEKDKLNKFIIHVRPMTYYICDDENNILIDEIFKIEEIEKIDKYLEEFGIAKLSGIFRNTSKHNEYSEYLDEEVIGEINRLYKKDFELFNYEML